MWSEGSCTIPPIRAPRPLAKHARGLSARACGRSVVARSSRAARPPTMRCRPPSGSLCLVPALARTRRCSLQSPGPGAEESRHVTHDRPRRGARSCCRGWCILSQCGYAFYGETDASQKRPRAGPLAYAYLPVLSNGCLSVSRERVCSDAPSPGPILLQCDPVWQEVQGVLGASRTDQTEENISIAARTTTARARPGTGHAGGAAREGAAGLGAGSFDNSGRVTKSTRSTPHYRLATSRSSRSNVNSSSM